MIRFFPILVLWSSLARAQTPAFRFHLLNEPTALKPWEQKNSSSGYLLSQLQGSLLRYQDRQLSGNLASQCRYLNPSIIQCTLRKNLRWSSGSPIKTEDFVRSFREFLSPKNHAFRADLLFPIKHARAVFAGKMTPEKLGIKAQKQNLIIELERPDSEFIYTLTSPVLAPLPDSTLPTVTQLKESPELWLSSGPFLLESWVGQKKIRLKPNWYFWRYLNFTAEQKAAVPNLEILFVSEDSVALHLYEKNELSFLRRLPTLYIPKYKNQPDYFEIDQWRFDYLGFSPTWAQQPQLRKALADGLRYKDLQELFHAHAPPGCPGFVRGTETLCHEFSLKKAQKLWAAVLQPPSQMTLTYSKQGGDDHQRSMEWIQSEWKKNLNLKILLNGMENKIFVDQLQKKPSDIFRKGVAPDRPTCLSALENFESTNSENYIRFKNKEFDQVLALMRASLENQQKQKLCMRGLHLLMDEAWIIPTGPIHFTLLVKPEWKGWKLNELNQLDLSELRYSKP
ncbi:MAG: peptide ABC transporter substrate-binding protein [Bdellovibrio sp. CG10_big_fil_rev_8_21_14_0_10_47_8]|nr:MAG: peptide ABC transporter substrate-binding protein [Bdellovibrio sp. CG10_big_fil_rev_8_21_14_0_10_47_8]